ncbi:uncharacterized protein I206_100700 [Kwoniella pini CBS 10737]|uniref:Uncharacterized protein n=1 Tax=Kwoniella pini CBS 10737 TaxID=1296096 RepID=A0A1B9ICF7_9TREE|nr:uncharacterized protein I206_00627 [Kwoniella pini CBS 10737]OCF53325.1 hypothetical protein I206_00627 [Kwoniella pini CBS 10737]
MNHTSPPLPNLHSLSISPPPGSYPTNNNQYRYNGVFGPPSQGSTVSPDWATSPKRTSRSGIPQGWYEPNAPPSRESPNLNAFEAFRRDAPSPPALSPPSSITSVPTTASSHPYQSYQQPNYPPVDNFMPMAVTPSPPPVMSYQLNTASSAPNLAGYNAAGGLPQFGSQSLASLNNNNRSQANGWRNGYGMPSIPASDEDVIPTAIVIKNIPFAVTRETLLGVMESLGAPLPYAFNYHHDNGVFRGLAFANFRAPDEAASVVAALNGYDVQGRKLRVEYKKVLQPGEKDKIEREKALKRMRSIQFDKSEMMPPPITLPNSRPISGVSMNGGGGYDNNSPPQSATSATSDSLPVTLDMNDSAVLDIYSRILVFKEDRMRDELAFSKNLTPTERRIVHLVAQKLGLSSSTRGEGESKSVVVLRDAPSRPTLTSSSSATVSSSYLSPYSTTPNDLSPNLRIKKSMPDLRGFNGPVVARDPTRSLNPQRSSGNLRADAGGRDYVSMGAAGGRRAFGNGNGNVANGFNSGSGSFNNLFGSSIGDIPPVPPLPSGLGLHSKGHSISSFSTIGAGTSDPMGEMLSSQPLRNPRGPAGESRGFGGTLRSSGNRTGTGGIMGRRVSEEDEEVENSSVGGRSGSGSGSIGSNSAVGSERHAALNQANGNINGNSNSNLNGPQTQSQGFMEGMRTRESLEP